MLNNIVEILLYVTVLLVMMVVVVALIALYLASFFAFGTGIRRLA